MAAAKARGVKMGRPRKLTDTQQHEVAKYSSTALDVAARKIGTDMRQIDEDDEILH